MRLCLGFMMHNEVDWLKLHLPVLLQSRSISGIVAVDGGSNDGSLSYVTMAHENVDIGYRAWDWKALEQETAVIQLAESAGYDAILFTAPDELWFPSDIDHIHAMLAGGHLALRFPTYNFVYDRLNYAPGYPYYPDTHIRAWQLNRGIELHKAIDSVPDLPEHLVTTCKHIHMYHYSHIKPRGWYALKGLNFRRVRDGLPPLDALPPDVVTGDEDYPLSVPFRKEQPLDPHKCGLRAPIE